MNHTYRLVWSPSRQCWTAVSELARSRKKAGLVAAAALLFATLLPSAALAATFTWDGGGADSNWTTAANWVGDIAPTNNDDLVFDGTTQLNTTHTLLGGSFSVWSITFAASAGAFTHSGDGAVMDGDIVNLSANHQTINLLWISFNKSRTINGGSGGITITSEIALGALLPVILTIDGSGQTALGVITDGASFGNGLQKNGSGTLTLSGSNTYSGGTSLSGGTIAVSSDSNLGNSSGTLTFNGGTLHTTSSFSTNRATTINSSGTFDVSGATTLTHNGVISGANLVKSGSGTLTLSGTNTYSGGTTISSGTLRVGGDNSLGNGLVELAGGDLGFNGPRTLSNAMSMTADAILIPNNFEDVTLSGNLGLGDNTRILLNNGSFSTVNLSGVVSGEPDVGLTLQTDLIGFNAVFFEMRGSQSNTYEGPTRVGSLVSLRLNKDDNQIALNGNVHIEGDGVLTTFNDEQIADDAQVVLADNATLNIGFIDQVVETIGSLDGSGEVALNNASQLAIMEGNFAGIISGDGVISKQGTGTLTLAGTNTYTGTTTVNEGTLAVDGSIDSATTVNDGATLGGSGSVTGTVTVAAGATLAPGNSPGTLTVNELLLDDASVLDFELGDPAGVAGTDSDLIIVNGDLILDGVLDVTALAGFGAGTYRLIDYTGTLTDNTLALGTLPAGYAATIDTATANQVNLVVTQNPYTVTVTAGAGGSANCAPDPALGGDPVTCSVTANSGYIRISSVGGTCPAGSWSGNTWTTGAIFADCSVSFSFNAIPALAPAPAPAPEPEPYDDGTVSCTTGECTATDNEDGSRTVSGSFTDPVTGGEATFKVTTYPDGRVDIEVTTPDGIPTRVTSAVPGSTVELGTDEDGRPQVTTSAELPDGTTLEVVVDADGYLTHRVTHLDGTVTETVVNLAGAEVAIDAEGRLFTSYSVAHGDTLWRMVVETSADGTAVARYERFDPATGEWLQDQSLTDPISPLGAGHQIWLENVPGIGLRLRARIPLADSLYF